MKKTLIIDTPKYKAYATSKEVIYDLSDRFCRDVFLVAG